MAENIFGESAVVKQFACIYSLYMVHGFCGLKDADWGVSDTIL